MRARGRRWTHQSHLFLLFLANLIHLHQVHGVKDDCSATNDFTCASRSTADSRRSNKSRVRTDENTLRRIRMDSNVRVVKASIDLVLNVQDQHHSLQSFKSNPLRLATTASKRLKSISASFPPHPARP